MSLVVKLEDDLGERSEWVMLHGVVPVNGHDGFLLLSGIDPFGKTVFNHLQMEAFLKEWDRAKDRAHDESQLEAWAKVKLMAESCRARSRLVFAVCRPIRHSDCVSEEEPKSQKTLRLRPKQRSGTHGDYRIT